MCVKCTYLGCYTAMCVYETKIHDIDDLQKCLMQTWLTLNTQGDSDVISSYQLFFAILWGKLCKMFVILTSVDVTFSIRQRQYGHFLKPNDSILFEYRDKSSPFNCTQYDVLTYKMAIALRPQICDVTSPYVQDVIDAAIHQMTRPSQIMCACWYSGHFEHMLWHERSFI